MPCDLVNIFWRSNYYHIVKDGVLNQDIDPWVNYNVWNNFIVIMKHRAVTTFANISNGMVTREKGRHSSLRVLLLLATRVAIFTRAMLAIYLSLPCRKETTTPRLPFFHL